MNSFGECAKSLSSLPARSPFLSVCSGVAHFLGLRHELENQ